MPPLTRYQSKIPMRTEERVTRVPQINLSPALDAWGDAAKQFEAIQDKLQKANDAVTLAEIESATRQDMVEVSNELTVSGDPVNRGGRFMERMQERSEARLAGYRETRPELYAKAKAWTIGTVGTHAAQEQAHGFALQRDDIKARAGVQLDELKNRYASSVMAGNTGQAEATMELAGMRLGELAASGVLTASQRDVALEKWKEGAAFVVMAEDANADAQAVVDRLRDPNETRYNAIAPERRAELATHYQKVADQQVAHLLAYKEYTDKEAAEEIKRLDEGSKERKEMVRGELYGRIYRNEDVTQILRQPGMARYLGDDFTKVAHFQKFMTTEGQVDDPEVAAEVYRKISQPVPEISVDQVHSLVVGGKLTVKTAHGMMYHIQSVLRTMKAEGRTDWLQRYQTARQDMQLSFDTAQVRSPNKKAEIAQLYTVLMGEFLTRTMQTKPDGTREDPMTVSQELIGRSAPTMADYNRRDVDQIDQGLPARYRGPQGRANLKNDLTLGVISEEMAIRYGRQMMLREQLDAEQSRPTQAPQTQPSPPSGQRGRLTNAPIPTR